MTTTIDHELTDEVVFDYWERKANELGTDRAATIRDQHFHDLEIDTIERFLRPTDVVLDIGCGNGYTTLRYAKTVARIVGVDFSPRMIESARRRPAGGPGSPAAKATFQVEDARRLSFPKDAFSRVVMQRCLINIPDREQQVRAALEAGRVLQTGEQLMLAEVTLQGHDRVNKYRRMFGLETLKTHWHNTYLDEPEFLSAISSKLELEQTIRFGMYGFLSKIVHALLVHPQEPKFDAPLNKVAATIAGKIPDFDGCSHQVLFVLTKK